MRRCQYLYKNKLADYLSIMITVISFLNNLPNILKRYIIMQICKGENLSKNIKDTNLFRNVYLPNHHLVSKTEEYKLLLFA